MNLVDSSGWIEYLTASSNAAFFAKPLKDVERLIVPAICIFEIFRYILRVKGKDEALQVAAQMKQGKVIPLEMSLSIEAAKLSFEFKLPMADSIILATARGYQATLWTQDTDFKNIEGVKFIPKKR